MHSEVPHSKHSFTSNKLEQQLGHNENHSYADNRSERMMSAGVVMGVSRSCARMGVCDVCGNKRTTCTIRKLKIHRENKI